ncbi:hypothetical protein F511_24605 [Dorcoceras hygrometricum]|uniref:60S acidic ribosomal protein P0 n=1 Tax=Dorcoceras hygrometricum TaxID=472368 RepID=A0A2Z7AF21_9LAMI|nr:hypothetical protein F511_24605 [Dorcoceras hygrometricum]
MAPVGLSFETLCCWYCMWDDWVAPILSPAIGMPLELKPRIASLQRPEQHVLPLQLTPKKLRLWAQITHTPLSSQYSGQHVYPDQLGLRTRSCTKTAQGTRFSLEYADQHFRTRSCTKTAQCTRIDLDLWKIAYDLSNGSVFSPEVLDLTEDDLIKKFALGVSMNILDIAVETHYSFPQADEVWEYLADPIKFSIAAAPVASSDGGVAPAAATKEEETKEEPAEESDDDMGFSLFD